MRSPGVAPSTAAWIVGASCGTRRTLALRPDAVEDAESRRSESANAAAAPTRVPGRTEAGYRWRLVSSSLRDSPLGQISPAARAAPIADVERTQAECTHGDRLL